jgi:hypothetical protein
MNLMELIERADPADVAHLEVELRESMRRRRAADEAVGFAVRRLGDLDAWLCRTVDEVQRTVAGDGRDLEAGRMRQYVVHRGGTNLHPVLAVLTVARKDGEVDLFADEPYTRAWALAAEDDRG